MLRNGVLHMAYLLYGLVIPLVYHILYVRYSMSYTVKLNGVLYWGGGNAENGLLTG